jgi:hypothetical protein
LKSLISLVSIVLLTTLGCGDEYYGTNNNANRGPYPVESEPSLSPDNKYIYYVSDDTASNGYGGIYRAAVADPVRERILAGSNLHSPVMGSDNETLAYLDKGKINYFVLPGSVSPLSGISDSFESIMFLDESIIIGQRHDSLFAVDEFHGTSTFALSGWDPTSVAKDTFVCIVQDTGKIYYIVELNKYNVSPDTLFTLKTNARPRWPSFHRKSGRLAFGLEFTDQRFIYSAEAFKDSSHFIDSTDFIKPYILNFDCIIFTGPDGRFYRSDFNGTKSVPFIHIEG